MKIGTAPLIAIFCATVSLAAFTTRGDSTLLALTQKRDSNCEVTTSRRSLTLNRLDALPRGEFEYVSAEYRVQSGSHSMRVDERVFRDGRDLKIQSQIVCSKGLTEASTSVNRIEQALPRIFNLQPDSMNVAYRSFAAGHEGKNSFFQIHDLPPALGISREEFLTGLRSEWSSHRFEKLSEPYHYALHLQRVTPSGFVEARVVYRNTDGAARAGEVSRRIADVAGFPSI